MNCQKYDLILSRRNAFSGNSKVKLEFLVARIAWKVKFPMVLIRLSYASVDGFDIIYLPYFTFQVKY